MTTFNELMESSNILRKKPDEGSLTEQDVIKASEVLISWCKTESNNENLGIVEEKKN